MNNNTSTGMRIFLIIWVGQVVSLMGTAMTRFALIIWAYQQTGDATTLALLGFFSFGSLVLVSPFAGVWIDRLDRRWVMLLADTGAGLMTMLLLLLYATDHLHIWHLYAAQFVAGASEAFQNPAYSAATTMLVPKQHYARANGLRSMALSLSEVGAPLLAGLLLSVVDIDGVMLVDVGTFLVALFTLLIVRIPRPEPEDESTAERHFWGRFTFGFRYIFSRRGLAGLMLIMVGVNLFAALTYYAILPAMVLARSGGDEFALAMVQASLGIGGIIGGMLISTWGGFRRNIHNVLLGTSISFILGDLVMGVGRKPSVWALGGLMGAMLVPFITGGYLAIWQAKVPPGVQGRVFVVQNALRQATIPLGYILGGLLADYVFEPAMMPGGTLVDTFGWLVGTGAGAGMALMFVCTAIGGCIMGLSGYSFAAVRNVETELPDHEIVPAVV